MVRTRRLFILCGEGSVSRFVSTTKLRAGWGGVGGQVSPSVPPLPPPPLRRRPHPDLFQKPFRVAQTGLVILSVVEKPVPSAREQAQLAVHPDLPLLPLEPLDRLDEHDRVLRTDLDQRRRHPSEDVIDRAHLSVVAQLLDPAVAVASLAYRVASVSVRVRVSESSRACDQRGHVGRDQYPPGRCRRPG